MADAVVEPEAFFGAVCLPAARHWLLQEGTMGEHCLLIDRPYLLSCVAHVVSGPPDTTTSNLEFWNNQKADYSEELQELVAVLIFSKKSPRFVFGSHNRPRNQGTHRISEGE